MHNLATTSAITAAVPFSGTPIGHVHLQHVFVITVKSAIWRSKDGGTTFEDITERFKSEFQFRTQPFHAGSHLAEVPQTPFILQPNSTSQPSPQNDDGSCSISLAGGGKPSS